jgi:hypothetical protein
MNALQNLEAVFVPSFTAFIEAVAPAALYMPWGGIGHG